MSRLLLLILFFSCSVGHHEKKAPTEKSKAPIVEQKVCDSVYFSVEKALENKECVVELALREKGFQVVPIAINEFPNLNSIDLSLNSFDTFPSESLRTDLIQVSLGHTGIVNLSHKIGDWKKLESLNLLFCKLSAVPKEICNCKNLKRLNLGGNKISDLPRCLARIKSLKFLSVAKLDSDIGLSTETIQYFKENLPDSCFFSYK